MHAHMRAHTHARAKADTLVWHGTAQAPAVAPSGHIAPPEVRASLAEREGGVEGQGKGARTPVTTCTHANSATQQQDNKHPKPAVTPTPLCAAASKQEWAQVEVRRPREAVVCFERGPQRAVPLGPRQRTLESPRRTPDSAMLCPGSSPVRRVSGNY
jgi:hypothetical protein